MSKERLYIFDTTLRDGAQTQGVDFSLEDKEKIASALDNLGVDYIEAGWPGANPTDTEFFQKKHNFKNSKLTSFGMTKRSGRSAENDTGLSALMNSNTSAVCLVGKSWDFHVDVALGITNKENLDNISESAKHFVKAKKEFMFDAEHFFDGYKEDSETSLKILESVVTAGADCFIFCDTNGGTLPEEVRKILSEVIEQYPKTKFGVHFQNDNGCAVVNSMVAVDLGVDHVQGTINGYGERTGNADLCTLIPNLSLKQNYETIPSDTLEKLTQTANHIAELVNVSIDSRHPYVGSSAFTHKAGLHASGMSKDSSLYEHIDASKVGNFTRTTVSELAGRASVITKAEEFGLSINNDEAKDLIQQVQNLEHIGFQFEAADASLFILMNSIKGIKPDFFEFESFRVFSERRNSENVVSEAVCKITVNNNRYVKTGEGVGPVDALSKALKSALENDYKDINNVKLIDYKVRIIDSSDGTEAKTRVLIEFTDSKKQWSTIGVHENIINASWNALCDGFNYYFMTS